MNKIFAFILFMVGIALMLSSACANPVIGYVTPSAPMLNTWGIVWRIGLGLILIVLAVVLNNMDSFGDNDLDEY